MTNHNNTNKKCVKIDEWESGKEAGVGGIHMKKKDKDSEDMRDNHILQNV